MGEQAGQYFDWTQGDQVAFITGIKWNSASPGKRAGVSLSIAAKPTAESYDSPFTKMLITFPNHDDEQRTKIMLDSKVKRILYPLAEVPADAAKVKIVEVLQAIKKNLSQVDFQCLFTMQPQKKTGVNSKTGEPITFYDCVAFKPMEAIAKKPYESGIDYDMSELPF